MLYVRMRNAPKKQAVEDAAVRRGRAEFGNLYSHLQGFKSSIRTADVVYSKGDTGMFRSWGKSGVDPGLHIPRVADFEPPSQSATYRNFDRAEAVGSRGPCIKVEIVFSSYQAAMVVTRCSLHSVRRRYP